MPKTQWSVALFIVAEVRVGNKRYLGCDLWPVFLKLCKEHEVEVTIAETEFPDWIVKADSDMTYDKASAVIRGFLFFLNFAAKAITA